MIEGKNTMLSQEVKNDVDVKPNAWALPDLQYHKPDCSSITDDELKAAVISKWPASKDGVVRIPYTFAGLPYFLQPYESSISFYNSMGLQTLDPKGNSAYVNNVKSNIVNGLKSWEIASDGKIQFYEDKLGLQSPGLSFYLADEKVLRDQNIIAFTQIKMDNDGYLNQASIVFPSAPKFWDLNSNTKTQSADNINTIVHEIGHAIGAEHFHDYPTMRAKIQMMIDGVYASVMPYNFLIRTDVNQCHGEHNNPPFAATPGPLDERFVQLNYKDNVPPPRDLDDYYMRMNVKNAFTNSASVAGAYNGIYSFASNLKLKPKENAFSNKAAHLIADGSFLAGMVYLRFPLSATASFALNASTKYLPPVVTQVVNDNVNYYIPQKIHSILASPYTSTAITAAGFAWDYYQGKPIGPKVACMVANKAGGMIGGVLGDKIGHFGAFVTGIIPRAVYAHFYPEAEQQRPAEVAEVQNGVGNNAKALGDEGDASKEENNSDTKGVSVEASDNSEAKDAGANAEAEARTDAQSEKDVQMETKVETQGEDRTSVMDSNQSALEAKQEAALKNSDAQASKPKRLFASACTFFNKNVKDPIYDQVFDLGTEEQCREQEEENKDEIKTWQMQL